MARRMVRIGDADLGIGAVAQLARELERHDAGDVALERQHLQVEHQPRVVGERVGHAHRAVEVGEQVVAGRRLRPLNLPLHLADAVEILLDPGPVGRPDRALEPRDVLAERVEEAGPALERGLALLGGAALAEEPLEHDAGMGLGGQRGRRRRPRQAVLVDAGVAVVADARERVQVHRQLERRQLRVLADLQGRELVGGGAEEVVGALGVLGVGGAEEPGVRRVVRARVGELQLGVRHHRELLLDGLEGAEDRRQLAQLVAVGGRPPLVVAAHRNEHVPEPADRPGRRPGEGGRRGNHRIEQRQGQGGLHALQKRTPR